MNERQIREGLESGRLHPFPLLRHLVAEEHAAKAEALPEEESG